MYNNFNSSKRFLTKYLKEAKRILRKICEIRVKKSSENWKIFHKICFIESNKKSVWNEDSNAKLWLNFYNMCDSRFFFFSLLLFLERFIGLHAYMVYTRFWTRHHEVNQPFFHSIFTQLKSHTPINKSTSLRYIKSHNIIYLRRSDQTQFQKHKGSVLSSFAWTKTVWNEMAKKHFQKWVQNWSRRQANMRTLN